MPRPTTKQSLLDAAAEGYAKLMQMVDALPPEAQNASFPLAAAGAKTEAHWQRDKNLRDVLVHLYEWHLLLLNWAQANRGGQAQPFLPPPYSWKSYGQMNQEFWAKHQATSLAKAEEMLQNSHTRVMELMESFTDEELFTKKYFSWTGTASLGSYCVSATSSHYAWAVKKLRFFQKASQSPH